MHLPFRLVFFLASALSLHATIGVDTTYEQVLAEKGPPSGKMQAGDNMVLRYPDATIRLRGGRVISVEAAKGASHAASPSSAPAPDTAPAKPESPAPTKTEPARTAEKGAWTTNYRAALAEAREQKRHVFLFFTGSDWCGWCMRLNKEILSTSDFARYASEKLVLVEIDFPKGKPQSADVKSQNAALAQRFRVQGFPTVIVLDGNGRQLGELGYQEGGPGPFVKKLKAL
jgi:thiol-disulfide isomerase/thioredoxin